MQERRYQVRVRVARAPRRPALVSEDEHPEGCQRVVQARRQPAHVGEREAGGDHLVADHDAGQRAGAGDFEGLYRLATMLRSRCLQS